MRVFGVLIPFLVVDGLACEDGRVVRPFHLQLHFSYDVSSTFGSPNNTVFEDSRDTLFQSLSNIQTKYGKDSSGGVSEIALTSFNNKFVDGSHPSNWCWFIELPFSPNYNSSDFFAAINSEFQHVVLPSYMSCHCQADVLYNSMSVLSPFINQIGQTHDEQGLVMFRINVIMSDADFCREGTFPELPHRTAPSGADCNRVDYPSTADLKLVHMAWKDSMSFVFVKSEFGMADYQTVLNSDLSGAPGTVVTLKSGCCGEIEKAVDSLVCESFGTLPPPVVPTVNQVVCPNGKPLPPVHMQWLHAHDLSAIDNESDRINLRASVPEVLDNLAIWLGPNSTAEAGLITFSDKSDSIPTSCARLEFPLGFHHKRHFHNAMSYYNSTQFPRGGRAGFGSFADAFYYGLVSNEVGWLDHEYDEIGRHVVRIFSFMTDSKATIANESESPSAMLNDIPCLTGQFDDCGLFDYPGSDCLAGAANLRPLVLFGFTVDPEMHLQEWYSNDFWRGVLMQTTKANFINFAFVPPVGGMFSYYENLIQSLLC